MKIKSVLLSALVATTALVSINANASTKDPATAYSDYYKMSAAQKAAMNTQTKTLDVDGKAIQATVTTGVSGVMNIALGDQHATLAYYNLGNMIIKAPASMSLNDINASLRALEVSNEIPAVSYVMTQAEMNKKS
ncbi:hypothetical protein CJP74_04325 [Psittacicella melopsittaci]|uniref:Uncharacterized protein n=1 Tax=Psittacicella melopsittaci TaxID=2028576 RepID=A0A3A1Y5K2_9GAMM|nr:hypothetical protein [Psittacicella melopsittaci]RIY31230.1 hypothetical protein CJP74_07775 [Psittacicella melopsittaci]RIY32549.1 hypothetical protein CJP74_04325 [Psittacicella melopsittaci]